MSPSLTDIASYWKKPPLVRVNSNTVATLKNFKKISSTPIPNSHKAVELFISKLPHFSTILCAQAHIQSKFSSLCMHRSALKFATEVTPHNRTACNFLLFLLNAVQPVVCKEACERTVQQSKSALWYSLRYGMILESTLYELLQTTKNESLC